MCAKEKNASSVANTKDFEHSSKKELIAIARAQKQEIDRLNTRVAALEKQIVDSEAILSSGSLAEAALKINKVFEAADAACRQYVKAVTGKDYVPQVPAEIPAAQIPQVAPSFEKPSKQEMKIDKLESQSLSVTICANNAEM